MIGVIAEPAHHAVAGEFFELFKTPWEIYRPGGQYDVLLCTGDSDVSVQVARLILVYSGRELDSDAAHEIQIAGRRAASVLLHRGARIPIYGESLTFAGSGNGPMVEEVSGQPAVYRCTTKHGTVVRIGYDLFQEIQLLLTTGQPAEYAAIPTVELHVALLRELIVSAGIPLIEIPPVPQGYQSITCLTHDVDHPSIRRHQWDRTMLGFLYRAVIGSAKNFFKGSIPFRDAWTNWIAALRLPLVYWGFADDFWLNFGARYREIEGEFRSTYFVIPFKDRPGRSVQGKTPAYRAAGYGASDISESIKDAIANGCEVGLHGIDAWIDDLSARDELKEIRNITGGSELGTRMHWLYFNEGSAKTLEEAGAEYDSTVGYRETVGFRAGTTQAYKPLEAERLLELPMHVMDTALFYPGYLGLSSREASTVLEQLAAQVDVFGGCLTINWHDRSLAPERLWYACYVELLADMKSRNTWFATAAQAVAWFQKRRSAVFERDGLSQQVIRARITAADEDNIPGLQLRIHRTQQPLETVATTYGICEIPFNRTTDLALASVD